MADVMLQPDGKVSWICVRVVGAANSLVVPANGVLVDVVVIVSDPKPLSFGDAPLKLNVPILPMEILCRVTRALLVML